MDPYQSLYKDSQTARVVRTLQERRETHFAHLRNSTRLLNSSLPLIVNLLCPPVPFSPQLLPHKHSRPNHQGLWWQGNSDLRPGRWAGAYAETTGPGQQVRGYLTMCCLGSKWCCIDLCLLKLDVTSVYRHGVSKTETGLHSDFTSRLNYNWSVLTLSQWVGSTSVTFIMCFLLL